MKSAIQIQNNSLNSIGIPGIPRSNSMISNKTVKNKFWGSEWKRSPEYDKILKKNNEVKKANDSRYNFSAFNDKNFGSIDNNTGFDEGMGSFAQPTMQSFMDSLQMDQIMNRKNDDDLSSQRDLSIGMRNETGFNNAPRGKITNGGYRSLIPLYSNQNDERLIFERNLNQQSRNKNIPGFDPQFDPQSISNYGKLPNTNYFPEQFSNQNIKLTNVKKNNKF